MLPTTLSSAPRLPMVVRHAPIGNIKLELHWTAKLKTEKHISLITFHTKQPGTKRKRRQTEGERVSERERGGEERWIEETKNEWNEIVSAYKKQNTATVPTRPGNTIILYACVSISACVCACACVERRVSALERAKGMPRVGWHIVVLIKNKPRAAALEANEKKWKHRLPSEQQWARGGKGDAGKAWLDAQIERKLLNF